MPLDATAIGTLPVIRPRDVGDGLDLLDRMQHLQIAPLFVFLRLSPRLNRSRTRG